MLSINFPAIVHSTLPQFLRPVLGAGSIISIEAGQGLILKAVTPSNFIQMSSLSLPLSSPSTALICRTEQTLDIFPSACQLSARLKDLLDADCFYPGPNNICVIKFF